MENRRPYTNLCGSEFDGVKRNRDMDKDHDNKCEIRASLECFKLLLDCLYKEHVISSISNKEQV